MQAAAHRAHPHGKRGRQGRQGREQPTTGKYRNVNPQRISLESLDSRCGEAVTWRSALSITFDHRLSSCPLFSAEQLQAVVPRRARESRQNLAECDRVSSKADFGMPFASFGTKKQTPLSTKALGQKLLKLLKLLRGWSLSAPPPG